MEKANVHVVGTGTIGEPLIGLLCEFREKLGFGEITFSKRNVSLLDRSKVNALIAKGAKLCAQKTSWDAFVDLGITPSYNLDEAHEKADVIIDCTPVGNKNKETVYQKLEGTTKGFIAQGSEFGFGKMYARGVNDESLNADDKYLQVVSCNTHNLSALIKTIAMNNGQNIQGLNHAKFVCIRRANDISQNGSFSPAHEVNAHSDPEFGTHHARDAHELFKTLDIKLPLFSSAMKSNTQYMHTLWFHLTLNEDVTREEVLRRLYENDRVALTYKNTSNSVFSFGRDHGHFGRILNQTVVVEPGLSVVNNREVVGWCFTPQDGNSLLSSLAAATYFANPDSYEDRVQCLNEYFYNEI
ncbi:hypothetical protein MRY82_08565 [bacterium]|nr:hypothetical protein [bacterium]